MRTILTPLATVLLLSACTDMPWSREPAEPEVREPAAQRVPTRPQAAETAAFEVLLHDHVHEAFQRAPGLDASGVEVRVSGATVYLDGHVPTSSQKALAHEVAHSVQGVESVVSDGLAVR